MGESTCRIAEINENLMRGELSTAERALHVTKRKRLYEEQHPDTKNGAAQKYQPKSQVCQVGEATDRFTKDTAE